MKPEREILPDTSTAAPEPVEIEWPEPQTELGAKLIALAKEIDQSDIPKLSIEEIEDYLGRRAGDELIEE